MIAMLELKTFGGLRLEANGAPCGGAAARTKTLALLALLAPGPQGMSRDKLIAYLWPETDIEHGRHLLKQACHDLRRELGQPELFRGRKVLQLNPTAIASDVGRFEAALEQGDLTHGLAEYTAPFLDGFYLDSCAEFERWVEAERERLARRASSALERLAKEAGARGNHATTAEWWRRLAELDPLSAEATLGRMRALAAAKERAEALKVGREYAELVRRELDAAPARAITKLMEQLKQQSDEPVALSHPMRPSRVATPEPQETAQEAPTRRGGGRAIVRKRSTLVAAGALAAVAAVLAIVISTRPPSARAVIAVGTIRDYSGSSPTVLGPAVAEMLATNLARAPELQVIISIRLREILGQTAADGDSRTAMSRAASRAGATHVLEGALLRHPDGLLRLQLQLVDLRTGVVWRAYVAEDRDPLALVDRLSRQLTEGFAAQRRR